MPALDDLVLVSTALVACAITAIVVGTVAWLVGRRQGWKLGTAEARHRAMRRPDVDVIEPDPLAVQFWAEMERNP